jgi:hypothetical protein
MRKFFLYLLLLIVLALGGLVAWIYLRPVPQNDALRLIPQNAVFVVQTNQARQAWDEIRQSQLWQHLSRQASFADIDAQGRYLDSLLTDNRALFELFDGQFITTSIHQTDRYKWDLLFCADLGRAANLGVLDQVFNPLFRAVGYEAQTFQYRDHKLRRLVDPNEPADTLFLTLVDNLLVLSYSQRLMVDALNEADRGWLPAQPKFAEVQTELGREAQFALFVQYEFLQRFLDVFLADPEAEAELEFRKANQMLSAEEMAEIEYAERGSLLAGIHKLLAFTATGLQVEGEWLRLRGATSVADTTGPMMKALLGSKPTKRVADAIAPARAGLYVGLQFDDFGRFYERYTALYAAEDSAGYAEYLSGRSWMEKWFGLDLQQELFSWFGQEIALVALAPDSTSTTGAAEHVLIIHTPDVTAARAGLEQIAQRIGARSPLRVRKAEYLDYKIHRLAVKGLFKLLLGKLFAQFDLPYYTFVDNCLVLTNRQHTLQRVLDDFQAGQTLSSNDAYDAFQREFDGRGNLWVYMNMPQLFPTLGDQLEADSWLAAQRNVEYLAAFRQTGFQLVAGPTSFKTLLQTRYQAPSPSEVTDLLIAANSRGTGPDFSPGQPPLNGRHVLYFSNKTVRAIAFFKDGKLHGEYMDYHKSGINKSRGRYRDGQRVGVWYFYRKNGSLDNRQDYGAG